jgi:hypothetical protein
MRAGAAGAHRCLMNDKTETDSRRRSPADRAARNGDRHEERRPMPAGMDLPVFGHVPYTSLGFVAGLGVAGAAGVIEWPVVAAVGIGYALARR